MKKLIGLAALVALGLSAQTAEEHHQFMKDAGGAMRKMRTALEAKSGSDLASEAKKVSDAFAGVEKFWTKRGGADDAVKLSMDAKTAADQLAAAATAGNMEESAAKLKALGSTCQGCHSAHREKLADGTYKIK